MLLKQPPNKKEKNTTTDLIEEAQKLSDSWFERGLPERPKDRTNKKEKEVDTEKEQSSKNFAY